MRAWPIKYGGATTGQPGMPAFGFSLSDEEIRETIHYLCAGAAQALAIERESGATR